MIRQLDLNRILHDCVELVRGAITIDIVELVRWFNGVLSRVGLSEIVRDGDWRDHPMRPRANSGQRDPTHDRE